MILSTLKKNAAISISYDSIEKTVLHLVNDSKFRNEIGENAQTFTKKFLSNYGNSSKMLAELLKM